jgi:hypothetical protein
MIVNFEPGDKDKTAVQLVYEFCKLVGICTKCNVKFAKKDNMMCERCAEANRIYRRNSYHNKKSARL